MIQKIPIKSIIVLIFIGCFNSKDPLYIPNSLDYTGNPTSPQYRESLVFSDQGAWFGYGFNTDPEYYGGFAGPFLMTQENGIWLSKSLSKLEIENSNNCKRMKFDTSSITQKSFLSHLEQNYSNDILKIDQKLFFSSPHTALIKTTISNLTNDSIDLTLSWSGELLSNELSIENNNEMILINSAQSEAVGFIQIIGSNIRSIKSEPESYEIELGTVSLSNKQEYTLYTAHSFIFPEYDAEKLLAENNRINIDNAFQSRIIDKKEKLDLIYAEFANEWHQPKYYTLANKTILTMQNNWRIAAGELKHSGLFPSYHYYWFHGFWAWDSWKHSVALSRYDVELAKDQIKAMYDFMDDKGFIADCVYRDTTIEKHNLRNTKPPLSGWAVWNVYQVSGDIEFLEEMYPLLVTQHAWWYRYRDHDQDGLCEYGSTDGSLIAAKWESGMDNAVRFDKSTIIKNDENAYSIDQESVDLNSYLYAEKKYLSFIANELKLIAQSKEYLSAAEKLKDKIQDQFYDSETGWFYDTSLDGKEYIKVMGCEGWIPLWANAASENQAYSVRSNMMNSETFFTKVPLPTLSASEAKFDPDGGYWRGPTWLDQAYFGVIGLKNYGYDNDAIEISKKLFHGADGILEKGKPIRENYNPVSGIGLNSKNFSWSAAHYLLLLID